jgi:hypothetical protein
MATSFKLSPRVVPLLALKRQRLPGANTRDESITLGWGLFRWLPIYTGKLQSL